MMSYHTSVFYIQCPLPMHIYIYTTNNGPSDTITLYSPGYNNIMYVRNRSHALNENGKTTKFDTMKTYVYISTLKRINDKDPSSQTCILYIYFFSETARIHVTVAAVVRRVYCLFCQSYGLYKYTKDICAVWRSAPGSLTYSGRQSINEAAFPRERRRYPFTARKTAERVYYIRRLRFTARNKTKTTVSRFTSCIIRIHIYYYVIERDDPLSLCKHAYTVYLRKDLYI